MSQEQEELMFRVRAAGPQGFYIGVGSRWSGAADGLVKAGLAEWRFETQTFENRGQLRSYDDYYLVEAR